MATAGFNAVVKVAGTSTAFANEATTKTVANLTYQITDTAKRVIDPTVAVTVEVDADGAGAGGYVAAAAGTFTVDYTFGKVTFTADQGASALVRISGNYLPLVTVGTAREASVSVQNDLGDSTVFGNAEKTAAPTLQSCSGSLGLLEDLYTDHDGGAGTQQFKAYLLGKTLKLVEIDFDGGGTQKFRGFVYFDDGSVKAAVGDLINSTINFKVAPQVGSGQTEDAYFGFGS